MKVYRYLYGQDTNEICDFGCKHRVTHHEVIEINETGTRTEFVKYLHYDKDGYGEVRIARSSDGTKYESWPTWDGYGPWVRVVDGVKDEDAVYWTRIMAVGDIARDQHGNTIHSYAILKAKYQNQFKD